MIWFSQPPLGEKYTPDTIVLSGVVVGVLVSGEIDTPTKTPSKNPIMNKESAVFHPMPNASSVLHMLDFCIFKFAQFRPDPFVDVLYMSTQTESRIQNVYFL